MHLPLLLVLATALHLPVTVEGPRVTVRAEAGLERLASRVAAESGRDLARIEADLERMPRWDHVEVRLVKHQADLGAAAGRQAPGWAIGLAFPADGVVLVAARGRDGELLDADRTLRHELAHLALGKALGDTPVPRWLTEGFAYLYSSDVSLPRAGMLMGALIGGRIKPLWDLEATFPAQENEAELAYAQAYDLVAWMARRGRWSDDRDDGDPSAFRQFLGELAAGKSLDEASRAAFGRRLVDVEAEWMESLRNRFLLYPLAFGGATLWVLGGLLLVVAWWRRRRAARRTMARWDEEERLNVELRLARATGAEAPSASDGSAGPAGARSP